MRILHVCQPTEGGAAVVVRQLAEAGVATGDDVTVASPAEGLLPTWVQAAGATWVELAMTRVPEIGDVAQIARLRRILPEFDVVHAHSSKAGALVRVAALLLARRPRVVFTPHGWSWYVGGRAAVAYRYFERVAARWTDVITVVSGAEFDDGRAVLRRSAPLELLENGVDTDAFAPAGPVAARQPGPLLVQVGRLSIQKGQDRSLRALARLTDATSRLRLIGEGPREAELRELAEELGVDQRVEFIGATDPRPHLRAADIVLLPSRWEGMSLALLEAMSTGKAIISSDCGGSDALGETGRVVAHSDDEVAVEQLTTELTRLLASPRERANLGRAARGRAQERYSLARVMARYHQVWRTPHPYQTSRVPA